MKPLAIRLTLHISIALLSASPLVHAEDAQNTGLTEEEKILYAVGAMYGGRLATMKLTEAQMEAVAKGFTETALGKTPTFDLVAYQPQLRNFLNHRMEKLAADNKKLGEAYLEAFVQKEGATKTESGLAFKTLKDGAGAHPKATDTVRVHYRGALIDGTVFESTIEKGIPVEFPLDKVIAGWTEGLQKVGVGGKIKLVVPCQLAYGDKGTPPKIPGGATLVFEIELLEIKKP